MGAVDRVGDERRRGIRVCRAARQHGHRIGDAERAGAAAPAGGRHAAHRHGVGQLHHAVDRGGVLVGDDAGAKGLARRQMPGDVAAVVHIGPLERAVGDHRRQHLVGDGTSYGRHRRDENFAVRPDGGGHAAGDRTFDRQACIADRLAQQGQLFDQLGQDGAEPIRRLSIGAPAGGGVAERLGYDVDRAVVQVQALAVREQRDLCLARHASCSRGSGGRTGHGLASSWARRSSLALGQHLGKRPDAVAIAAERLVVGAPQGELDGGHQGRRRHVAEGALGHARDVDHERDAAARPDVDRSAAAGDAGERIPDRAGEPHRVLGDARAQRAAGPAHEQHRGQRRLAVLGDPLDRRRDRGRHRCRERPQLLVQHVPRRVLAGGRDHQQAQARPGDLGVDLLDDRQRVDNVGAAPARAGLCDLKIAPGRGAAAAHPDAGRRHVEEAAGLVLGQHARDVVVDHDHLVGVPRPLLGEDADRGRAAADPHALLLHAVHDRCSTRLQRDRSTAVDRDLDRRAVAELQQRLAGDVALALGAAGQMAHAAEREHLGAVLGGRDVADLLAVGAHRRLLGPEIAVGVDLHLEAAIAEDALRDDGHHVDALDLARDDERCGLVVGIGGAGADAGDERLRPDQLAVPVGGVLEERHPGLGALGDHERIDPDQEASLVGVAIACADLAGPDPAEHRACVAPDNLVSHGCDHPAAWSTAIKCPCTGGVKAGPAPAGARCCAAAQGGISLWPCGADEPT